MGIKNDRAGIKLKECSIYLAPNAQPSVKLAADELQTHVKLATGLTLPITNAPVHPMIALGNNPAAVEAGLQTDQLPYETIRIVTKSGNLYLLGRDLPNDGITSHGGRSLGTLYATYEFIERVLGVRWLMPGEHGAYIPSLGENFELGNLDRTYTPPFCYREFSGWRRNVPAHQKWFGRGHVAYGLTAGFSRCIDFNHAWYVLYPGPKTAWAAVLKDMEKTFADNPEFFEMASNGKRIRPVGQFSLCLSNPEIAKDVADRVLALAAWKRKQNPELQSIQQSLCPNDSQPSCACANCVRAQIALSPETLGQLARTPPKTSWTPLVLDYYRAVAERVKAADAAVELGAAIYDRYEFAPPQKPAMLPDNFCAAMCPLYTGYGPVRLYEPVNQAWCKWFDSWEGVFHHQFYYGVDFWMRQFAGAPLPPFPGIMKQTFDRMRKAGYLGGFFYYNDGLGQSAPYNWMTMQMLWNPSADPDELFGEFCAKAYGQGGGDIKKLYQLAEENWRKFFARREGVFGYNLSPEVLEEVYARDWDKYQALFLAAESKAATPGEKWRLAMLGENLKLLYYHLTRQGSVVADRNSPLYMSDADFQKFNARRGPGGDLEGFVHSPSVNPFIGSTLIPLQAKLAANVANAEEPKLEKTYFQYHADIIIMSPVDQDAVVQLSYSTLTNQITGKDYLPETGYFNVYDQDRKLYYTGIAEKGKITFPVQKNKIYYLIYACNLDYSSGSKWRLMSVNVPCAIGQRVRPEGLLMANAGTPLYFHVPDNAGKFKLYFIGSNKAEIRDPAGTLAATVSGDGHDEVAIDRAKGNLQPGWWKISYQGHGGGNIRQSDELAGYFVLDPKLALQVEPLAK